MKQHSLRCKILSVASGVLLATGAFAVAAVPVSAATAPAPKAAKQKPAASDAATNQKPEKVQPAASAKPATDKPKPATDKPKPDKPKPDKAKKDNKKDGSSTASSDPVATDPQFALVEASGGTLTAAAAKAPNAKKAPVSGQCGENSFLGSLIGGSNLGEGSVIGATYHDETPLNRQTVQFTIDGTPVQPDLKDVSAPKGDKFATDITITLTHALMTSLGGGTHTAMLRAEDTDQNKAGGDCGVATFTFSSQAVPPPPPPQAAPPPPQAAPPPPAVLGTVVTRAPTPVAAPAAPAAPARLALTGSSSLQLGLMGLALLSVGAMLRRISRRPARPTRFLI